MVCEIHQENHEENMFMDIRKQLLAVGSLFSPWFLGSNSDHETWCKCLDSQSILGIPVVPFSSFCEYLDLEAFFRLQVEMVTIDQKLVASTKQVHKIYINAALICSLCFVLFINLQLVSNFL